MSAAGAVAPAAAAGAPGAPGAPAPAAAGGWSLSSLLRMLMMYYVVSSFMGRNKTPADVKDVATGVVHRPHRNAWPENTPYSLYVFVHDEADLNVAQHTAATLHPRSLIWFESGLKYGWEEGAATERALNWSMTADSWPLQHLHANGTLYAHTFFVRDHTPLFPYRAKGDVAGEEAYTHTHDALVVGSAGTALSSPSGAAPALVPIPSATSASFADAFVPNPGFDARNIIHRTMVLNIYRPAPKVVDKKNLLGVGGVKANSTELEVQLEPAKEAAVAGDAGIDAVAIDPEDEDEFEDLFDEDEQGNGVARRKGGPVRSAGAEGKAAPGKPWLSYWKPFLHIRLIPDWTVFPYGGIPAEMTDDYVLNPSTDAYDPPVYFDYFWLLQDQLTIVNSTVSHLSLNLSHTPLSLLKWRLETQMETSWKMQQNWGMQEEDGRDSEMFKKMVMDTNIYLLAITFVVSILHAVFDFLAFKNDVKFWKEAKSMRGLSTRSILLNCVCQIIIFFYLLDNDTSYMILLSSGVGIVIEIWKVQKGMTIRFDRAAPFPHIKLLSKTGSEEKKEEEKTEDEKEMELHAKYDSEAMTYLSYALYPLVCCYAAYSLYYDSHKSWYSFVLSVLTGCVYTFGFIMMCPQLYMNYKLRSVAHLPWRMLTYKALNTFIDDLFAFVITMPTLHRLACFRDDLIFFIFLYQKWAYRTDYKRVNEFGAAFVSEEEQKRIEDEDRAAREKAERAATEAKRGAHIEEVQDEKEDEKEAESEGEGGVASELDQPAKEELEASMRQRKQAAAAAAIAASRLTEMD